jgi:hypothetical protein
MKVRFDQKYFYLTIVLFVIEVLIAVFVNDRFIRPLVGDILVVMLVYCFVRAFWKVQAQSTILGVFAFACGIEFLQYLSLVDRLGLRSNKVLSTIIGTTFDWKDILAYGIGCALLWLWEGKAKTA